MDNPFSKSYVLRVTTNHMKGCIDRSIRKTFDRKNELQGDKHLELMETLDVLHRMRSMIEDFEEHNTHLYNPGDNNE